MSASSSSPAPSSSRSLLGSRLLPVRENRSLPPDLSRHARTLVEQFRLDDGVHQLRVRPESPLVGQPRAGLDLGGPRRA